VWFDDFRVGEIQGDPVRLGFKVGWNYYGDRALFYTPYAQQTRCKNSVAPIGDRHVVTHQNRSKNFREMWDEAIRELGIYGDELAQQIAVATDILYDFDRESGADDEDIIPMPMSLESFYGYVGLPDPRVAARHAREESANYHDPRTGEGVVSAWHVHAGATYWLSWHWNGSEDSRAFKEHRRLANDLLFNPHQKAEDAVDAFESEAETEVVRAVLGEGRDLSDATDEELAEIEDRLAEDEAVATARASADRVGDLVESFTDTEERLDRMEEAMAGGEAE
jgi:hypothetical protein